MKAIIGVEQEPRVQFTIEVDDYDKLPDLIKLPDGSTIVHLGRYLGSEAKFSYKRVRSEMTFSGEVKGWIRYSGLIG